MILLMEILLLFTVGFIPHELDTAAAVLVSFTCAMQVQAFRKIDGYSYDSIMCIGNLRSGMEALSVYMRDRSQEQRKKIGHYFGMILFFAVGAGIGGNMSVRFGIRMIWISCLHVAQVFFMLFFGVPVFQKTDTGIRNRYNRISPYPACEGNNHVVK